MKRIGSGADLLLDQLIKVAKYAQKTNHLQHLIGKLLVDDSIEQLHPSIHSFLNQSIDKIVDQILEKGASSSQDDTRIHVLLVSLAIFSVSAQSLLEPHLCVIKHFAESKNPKIVEAAVSIFAQCFSFVSVASLKNMQGIVETLTKVVLTGSEAAVKHAIDCLYSYCNRVYENYDLILKLWSKFSKYLKSQIEKPDGPVASYSRALYSLGCLCRHSGQQFDEHSKIPAHVTAVIHVFTSWFSSPSANDSIRLYALQALMMTVEAFPSILIDDVVYSVVIKANAADQIAVILNGIHSLLDMSKLPPNHTKVIFDPSAANRQTVNPLLSLVIQKYLHFVMDSSIINDHSCRLLSVKVLFQLLLLGNANPFLVSFIYDLLLLDYSLDCSFYW